MFVLNKTILSDLQCYVFVFLILKNGINNSFIVLGSGEIKINKNNL